MPTLMTGLKDEEVRWDKFKNSYMYNDTYYLRRTKFIIYQCATTSVGICSGIAGPLIHKYKSRREDTLDAHPDVDVELNDIIAVLALNIAGAGLIGLVFTPAIFFDLFWPERWEAPLVQRLWKYSAATCSVLQFAAATALAAVMATSHVNIKANSVQEWVRVRELWSDRLYNYQSTLDIVAVIFSWIAVVSTIWSTIVMLMAYRHNNRHGPFNHHVIKPGDGTGVFTEESNLAMTM